MVVCSLTPPILADENQLTQMFTNLFINSADAMPDGGDLIVYTKIETEPESEVKTLTVNIKDSGIGIPSKDMAKLFKPFFTAKPKGTGLGLAIVQKIVQNHKGSIRVESKINEGTNVIISLPTLNNHE
jgi:signal transduction histidine kinase